MLLKYEAARQPELRSALNIAQNLKINNLLLAVEWGVHSPALALSRRCTLKVPHGKHGLLALFVRRWVFRFDFARSKKLWISSERHLHGGFERFFFSHQNLVFKNPTQLDIWIIYGLFHMPLVQDPGT